MAPPDSMGDFEPDGSPGPVGQPFNPDRVLRISISMDDEDWDELRHQTRHSLDVLGASCSVAPPSRPYVYFSGDVTIDGVTVSDVGVRKKGFFGSVSDDKPSLKLKFSEYVEEQRFSGLKRMTLNNNLSDPSQIKQCLGYDLFASAGVPAPRCNFATVEVNGTELGTYTHVESIDQRFLARRFADADGNLYEGTLTADFRLGWVNTFEKKTNEDDADRSDVEAVVSALQVEDDVLLETLEPLVDIDAFIDFWAMEVILMHADGYARSTNNYYFYRDPTTGKFMFIPWGIDVILYPDRPREWESEVPPGVAWAEGALARRLYLHPETQFEYLSRVQRLLDAVWDEAKLHAEIDRMEDLLAPELADESAGVRELIARSVDEVRQFVSSRRGDLESILAAPAAPWERPLRDPFCLDPVGTVSADFATRWGTLDAADPWQEGSANVSLELDNERFLDPSSAAVVGLDASSGQGTLRLFLRTPDERTFIVQTLVTAADLDASLPLGRSIQPGQGALFERVTSEDGLDTEVLRAELDGGTLRLERASAQAGAPISGSFSASLYVLP